MDEKKYKIYKSVNNFLISLNKEELNKFFNSKTASSQYLRIKKIIDNKEELSDQKKEELKGNFFWAIMNNVKLKENE